jgi:hypothetical protein
MTKHSTSEKQIRSRAWLLYAEFDVAGHPRLADIQKDKQFPEYIREYFDAPALYLCQRTKGLLLLSFSMPTAVSSLRNRAVVPVVGIIYDSRVVCENTIQHIFRGVDGLTVRWGALEFGPGTDFLRLHDHPAYIRFLGESSLGGMDPALMWCVDCRGFSDARTWTFEAVLEVAHHPDLINNS